MVTMIASDVEVETAVVLGDSAGLWSISGDLQVSLENVKCRDLLPKEKAGQ